MRIYQNLLLLLVSTAGLTACVNTAASTREENPEQKYIEYSLNLANNSDQEWTYYEETDAWVLSIVPSVAYPELPDQQGVSVCVPGAYITGIDSDGDGKADLTSTSYSEAVKGSLIIDYKAEIISTNGQVYKAATAPVIINTGAAGYGPQMNSPASTNHAADGYINVSMGNRGKQDTATDADGNTYYTGDAPSCLVDQKAAARFVKYNILLGNLPGNIDYFVSTGGSGAGAHAAMFAATSNNPDFYDYQIEAGAVGVYREADGSCSTSVTIDGKDYDISDGAWGSIAYSAITPLYEADMAQAFEYNLYPGYSYNTPFQAQLAEYLSAAYMEYINDRNLSVLESAVGHDINKDGDLKDKIKLTIECDPGTHGETNGYYGTYLDLYLSEFVENLQWYLDSLDYSVGWTWFDEKGAVLSDEAVASLSSEDRVQAFLEGRYTKGSTAMGMGPGGMGMPPGGMMGPPPGGKMGQPPAGMKLPGGMMVVGTPDAGTTQSATSSMNSADYETYTAMVEAYKADIDEIYSGDRYGNNIVSLYNPLAYIGGDATEDPVWTKIICGASEGDISMFNSLNLQLAWLSAGVDSVIEWQWDGGHVPSEVLGDSFSLYVDTMYGKHVRGAVKIEKPAAVVQTENGTSEEASGKNISSWVDYSNGTVSFTLAEAAAYRSAGASKAVPGFDVIDYGQEDYVFGSSDADARHWDTFLLRIFEEHSDILKPLFESR